MSSIHIVSPNQSVENLFIEEYGFNNVGSKDWYTADVLLFTGGLDISPHWYGELDHPMTQMSDLPRDVMEILLYKKAVSMGMPVVGICRGAQLINVLNGGRLWQHVDNHDKGLHGIWDEEIGEWFEVTSTHHQMMRMAEGGELVAAAWASTYLENMAGGEHTIVPQRSREGDPEIIHYPKTKSLCVQFHPEYHCGAHWDAVKLYFLELLERKDII